MNVFGSLESKLEDVNFVKLLSDYDVIMLSECWINKYSVLTLDGYEHVSKPRLKNKKAKRESGGIVCYFKKALFKGIIEKNWDFEDGMIFEFDKHFFGFTENLILICPYMRPSNSTRNLLDNGVDAYDLLTEKIAEYKQNGRVLIIGDIKTRTGNLDDIADNDNDDDIDAEKIVTPDDLTKNGLNVKRANKDIHTNEYGIRLIRLCKMSDLVILNGRAGEDKSEGRFTYSDRKGSSTIDYMLCCKNLLKSIKSFYVGNSNVFSDHMTVSLIIKCNTYNIDSSNMNTGTTENSCKKVKWRDEKKDEYKTNINSLDILNRLQLINAKLDKNCINQNVVDECVNDLNNVLLYAGKSHSVRIGRDNYYTSKCGIWYDRECITKRDEFKKAEHAYRITGMEEDRISMCNKRNLYRKCCRHKRLLYQRMEAEKLLELSKKDARKFWKLLKSGKDAQIGNCNFKDYFEKLCNVDSKLDFETNNLVNQWEREAINDENHELDMDFSMKELDDAISKLKNNKAAGYDEIVNEFITNGGSPLKYTLIKLFNNVFNSGYFPQAWAVGEIVPIFKKGEKDKPENYRGITLLSCMGKLFTSILNNRINVWAERNNYFCENQFGFRQQRATTDCLFILHSVIELLINHSKPLYCAFVDLERAFDSTHRNALWYKLYYNCVSIKVINLVKNMYSKIRLRIKQSLDICNPGIENDDINAFFTSQTGVFQGESLSPLLFSFFLNDLDDFMKAGNVTGVNLNEFMLTILLFADDMALLSQSREGLQTALDRLGEYCDKWGLVVNISKTKCIAFKKGGRRARIDKWTYKNVTLETVDHFKYLGFVFGSAGKFAKGIQALADQAQRAIFSLNSVIYKYPEIMPETRIKLFKTLISPILSYACEIWGFCEADPLERIYLKFQKSLLSVRKNTPSCFIYKELHTTPLKIDRLIRIISYWIKIIHLNDNSIVKIAYMGLYRDALENSNINWAFLVKGILETHGFGCVWHQQSVPNINKFLSEFKQRANDIFVQKCNEQISSLSEHRLYKHLNDYNFNSSYLQLIKERYIRVALTRLRLGSHSFLVERGRWQRPKLDFFDRICETCEVPEDEYHIFMECIRFNELRENYLPRHLYERPNMYKFISLINCQDYTKLKSLGTFCHKVFIKYLNNFLG